MIGESAIGAAGLGSAAAAPPETGTNNDAMRQRVKQMAQEFEAMLLTQMLREMRQSMLSDEGDEKGLGKDTMTDSLDIELGGVLSRAGGFGLTAALSKAMDQRLGAGAAPSAVGGPAVSGGSFVQPTGPGNFPSIGATGASIPESSTPESLTIDQANFQVPRGRVSSAYGWRSDPFNGATKFHNGIDVAQAYGQDVRAAAGGRVAFAGDRGSYGTTIIVEHPGGRRTLYGHLSATDVRAGDSVDSGQVIGKSGSSGHSTGPHLHFEVLDQGRPVDPVGVVAGRLDASHTWTAGD
ncbi:MAG: peptidoglycan DD-metalloendopeptidase family protein [Acidobacteriota bacterium]